MLRPLLALAPRRVPAASPLHWIETFPAEGERRMRVALLPGCAQQVLAPEINLATIRLLTRHGCEVVVAPGSGCCGALHAPSRRGGAGAGPGARQYRRLGKGRGSGRARRRRRQCLGLRHDAEGLRVSAAHRPGLRREGGADRGPRARRQRNRRGARAADADRAGPGAARRLSLGLLVAARAEDRPRAESAARRRRV